MNVLNQPLARLRAYLELVKFEHTLFALPFAYAGMVYGAQAQVGHGWPGFWVFCWITLAMAGARTAAMALNRVIDAAIDARNPRTAMRQVPRGTIKPLEGIVLALVSLLVLVVAASQLNPLCLALLPLAVLFLVLYPYTKRFTWLCHVWLGITDGAAAAGGYIAVTGRFDAVAWWLWAVVVFWMVGLDVVYATQDLEFDKRNALHSIPVRFGLTQALRVAAWSHAITWALLLVVGVVAQSAWPYYLGVVAMGGMLWHQHRIVSPKDLARVNEAFFSTNAWLAATMLLAVIADVLVRTS